MGIETDLSENREEFESVAAVVVSSGPWEKVLYLRATGADE